MCSMFLFKWLLERNDFLICIAILSCHRDLIFGVYSYIRELKF